VDAVNGNVVLLSSLGPQEQNMSSGGNTASHLCFT